MKRIALCAWVFTSLAACDDASGPSSASLVEPTGVRVTVTTTGLDIDIDRDGYRVAVDGTDQGPISANGTRVIRLDPGSRTIALTDLAPNCAVDDPGSRTVTVVAAEVAPIDFAVVCTATPGVLAFESGGDIYIAHMDGSNLRRLTSDGSPNSYNREAAWSPDGNRIAFSQSDGQSGAAIYVIHAQGGSPRRLSPEGASDAAPTWSPDGSRIAFVNIGGPPSFEGHIFVMNADGTNRVQLTTNRQPNSSPAWSPDGRQIAHVTYSDVPGDRGTAIFVMNADGTNRMRLTSEEWETDPEWSPDGSRIVFSRSGVLFVMDADGTNLTRLTPARSEPGGSSQPAWSPDGLMIAFTRATNCHVDPYGDPSCDVGIWAVRIGSGAMYELPLQVGSPRGPSWRP